MRAKFKNFIQLAWINIKVFLVLALVLEIAGQLIYFYNHHQLRLTARPIPEHDVWTAVFEKHPYLVVRLKPDRSVTVDHITASSTHNSLRPTGADENDTAKIRIACVGGSSTYCVQLTDEDAWPSQLQKKLGSRYAVFNYGMPGFSTTEGIIQSALLLPEIKPDIILYYEGWNDIKNYHDPAASPDNYAHGMFLAKSLACDDAELKCYNAYDAFLKFSGLAYITQVAGNHVRNYFRSHGIKSFDHPFKSPDRVYDTPDPRIDSLYFRNLNTLQAIARAHGAIPVFIPQIMNPHFVKEGEPSLAWSPYIRANDISKLMSHFNTVMDSVCTVYHCDELKDIHKNQNWTADCFVDEGHLSKKGANQLAEIVYQKIKQLNIPQNGLP